MKTLIPLNQPDITAWNALTYFNFYRFLVAFLFVALFWIGQLPGPLGIYDRTLFAASAHIYLIFSIIVQFLIRWRRPAYAYQVALQVITDIVIITLLMYASDGLNSGFGMLLVIAVAGGGLLSPGRISILFGALATIAVLGHEIYGHFVRVYPPPNYTHAGILGIAYFVTAYISHALASRVQESEALARQRGIDLENLARLNEHIVQRLQSGIVVIDAELKIQLINESAANFLGIDKDLEEMHIKQIAPVLAENAHNWTRGQGKKNIIIQAAREGVDLQVSFVPLNLGNKFRILIFVDDVSLLRQRAQNMKLASLARLTASIAHEVRNPLGAISHAGQLLSESASLNPDDKRLTAIISEHSNRVNRIIENIMSISRREQAAPVMMDLNKWLENFLEEFKSGRNLKQCILDMHKSAHEISVRMDPAQFRQILVNLLENALRYTPEPAIIRLEIDQHINTGRPYIDIRDNGPGIPIDTMEHLFEPFFTTSAQGTGLGLYIARELCEANQATLSLYGNSPEGCCFRINFAHPDKQHSVTQ
jgi:two-component system sensor histidine kinase PilS (NtrC family)